MIRGIIFDCFGVLCEGSLDHLVRRAAPDAEQAVIDTNHAADRGLIDHGEYIAIIASLLNLAPDEVRQIIRTYHVRVEPMFELARRLKPQYKLGLLSNVGDGVINELFSVDELTHLFDAVVLSGEVGMVKPYPEIYELTAERLRLRPEECLMIDDIPRNIEGAELAGMTGIVFGSVSQLQEELIRFKVDQKIS